MTADADALAAVAVELAGRVRDDNPEANYRWLKAVLPDPNDWFRLAFVLAAAIPDDRPWLHLTAWTVAPPPPPRRDLPEEHGTYRAARRHRRRKEPLCTPCVEAEREYVRTYRATHPEMPRSA